MPCFQLSSPIVWVLYYSSAHFLDPAFAATLFPPIIVPPFVAELSLTLWLIVKGVDVVKWRERASAVAI